MERRVINEGTKWRPAAFEDNRTNQNTEKDCWTIKLLRRYKRAEKNSYYGKKIFLQF